MVKPLPYSEREYKKLASNFSDWLLSHGSEMRAPSNLYEVARFTTPEGVGVIYRNVAGKLSWQNGADKAWQAFRGDDNGWRVGEKRKRGKLKHRIDAMKKRDGDDCWYCGGRFAPDNEPSEPGLKLTIEHLCPVIHGGPDHLGNLVIAHEKCNTKAGNLSVADKVRMRESMRSVLEGGEDG